MHDIDETLSAYFAAIDVEGKSVRTQGSYRDSLEALRSIGRRLGLPQFVEEYTVENVYQFLAVVRAGGASADFQQRRQREIRTFFSWCRRMGYLRESVFAQVPLVKVPQKIREPFSREEVATLLASQNRREFAGSRNYALLLFLLDTGVRASECALILLEDVDWIVRRILIQHAKGQKQRQVAMSEITAEALRQYLDRFRGWDAGPLFISRRATGLSPLKGVHQVISRLGTDAGVPHSYPHRFRHTFATWSIESGAREIDVQMLLGHSSMAMTQRYARTYTSAQAVAAHAQMSPVSRLMRADDASRPPTGASPKPSAPTPSPFGGRAFDVRPKSVSRPALAKTDVKVGVTLVATYRGQPFTCRVVQREDGLGFAMEDGREFGSPSAAARSVTRTQVNGYRFWSLPDPDKSATVDSRSAASIK